ncbi:hypothetical protein ACFV7Q_09605 [Streptomyces sp. NPDC059851]|uniref:hypothetical protein n=1 Tax=Streptomyces sp. NPDC059851 TaxID=3346971 RepID=UPI0036642035
MRDQNRSQRECYGIRVDLLTDPDALPLVDEFFGPPATAFADSGTRLDLEITVSDEPPARPSTEPPHNAEVLTADPIVIDTGGSRAVIDPTAWKATVTLARTDLDDPVVWGRWILERLFLYLVCRSERHYPLHTGAIGIDGRTALISAPTGVGKSTFTYWAAHRGAVLYGEDIMVRHLDEAEPLIWGHPRVTYLSPDLIARCPELDAVPRAGIDGGRKYRLGLTGAPGLELDPAARPDAVVFLTQGEPSLRDLDLDEAVERSRGDFSTAKSDPALLTEVETDLRTVLGGLPVWELGLSLDLDATYDLLRTALNTR